MKTTKEIAEIFCGEIDRIGKGEIRKDVISSLEKCTASLIKLARLEMDFSFRSWGDDGPPNIPWLANNAPKPSNSVAATSPQLQMEATHAATAQGQQIERQICDIQKQLADPKCTPTLKKILTDKIGILTNRLGRVEAQSDAQDEGEESD